MMMRNLLKDIIHILSYTIDLDYITLEGKLILAHYTSAGY
jgi:hypothetical protein